MHHLPHSRDRETEAGSETHRHTLRVTHITHTEVYTQTHRETHRKAQRERERAQVKKNWGVCCSFLFGM
jgi:hypothetical protein